MTLRDPAKMLKSVPKMPTPFMLTLGCWNVAWSERLVVHVMVLCLVIEILFSPVTCRVSVCTTVRCTVSCVWSVWVSRWCVKHGRLSFKDAGHSNKRKVQCSAISHNFTSVHSKRPPKSSVKSQLWCGNKILVTGQH